MYTAFTSSTQRVGHVHTHRSEIAPATGDAALVARLRRGDEVTFALLFDQYQKSMLRVAQLYVGSYALAEEVVQDAWIGLLQSLERFEGRCSLKTWIFRILVNRAKGRGVHEQRCIPFSALHSAHEGEDEPSVDPADIDPTTGQWTTTPQDWSSVPEDRFLAEETQAHIQRAIDELPETQRAVISLRDIAGWTSEEVRELLALSEANQRVLLHRARSKVRRALEGYLGA